MSDIVLLDAAWDGVAADVEALLDSWSSFFRKFCNSGISHLT